MKITDKDSYINENTIVRSFLDHPEVAKFEQINAFGISYFVQKQKDWLNFCSYLTSIGRLMERFENKHNIEGQKRINLY
jgi:phage pi2 protein 07